MTGTVGVGFAWRRIGVGGVRGHLENLHRHSRYDIRLYPEDPVARWAIDRRRQTLCRSAMKTLDLSQHQLVHSHVEPEFIRQCRRAKDKGTPWVHTYHTLYFPSDWNGELQPWQERINDALIHEARHADRCLCISRWLQEHLQAEYDIETTYIPNGFDDRACQIATQHIQDNEATDDRRPIVFSGSDAEVKNPTLFVSLADRMTNHSFGMFGKGLTDHSFRSTWPSRWPSNLALWGPKDHTEALATVAASRLMVVTSHSEGLPTAVMEAMAMGIAVVAPNSHGCADLIDNGQTGYLFEPNSLDDLIRAVNSALDDPDVGCRAADSIRTTHSWPAVADQIDAVYQQLIE